METTTTATETKKPASIHALAAKAIRADLKKAFPGVKFGVRSETFSMGDSATVSWTDGPAVETVKEIADKYQAGDFDGMTDSYNFRENAPDVSVKFVSCDRSISEALRSLVETDIAAKFSGTSVQISDMAYQALRRADLRPGYSGIAFVNGRCEVVTGAPTTEAR
jgi:hypothetical protein